MAEPTKEDIAAARAASGVYHPADSNGDGHEAKKKNKCI